VSFKSDAAIGLSSLLETLFRLAIVNVHSHASSFM